MSKICIPLRASSVAKLKKLIRIAEKAADIFEIWVDQLPKNVKPAEIIRFSTKPLLIVNKTVKEGGGWKGSEKERLASLKKWQNGGADYIDAALNAGQAFLHELLAKKKNVKLILSYHNYQKTPSLRVLKKILKRGLSRGADIVKIVPYAKTPEDNLAILNLLIYARKKKLPLVAFAMGKYGKISRIAAAALGSQITYVALNEKEKTAPGQPTVKEYKTISSLMNL